MFHSSSVNRQDLRAVVKADLQRLLSLPEKLPVSEDEEAQIREAFEKTGRLKQAQVEMLVEAGRTGGLLAKAPVGAGKTLVTACLPRVMGIPGARTVLLVPASLVQKTQDDFQALAKSFDFDPPARILSYESISRDKGWADLQANLPELIILDEAHKVAVTTTRGKRLRRLIVKQNINVAALSGSLDRATLTTQAGIAGLALGLKSPFPLDRTSTIYLDSQAHRNYTAREYWHSPKAVAFCEAWLGLLPRDHESRQVVVRERLSEFLATRAGVYAPEEVYSETPLSVRERDFRTSPAIIAAQHHLEQFWEDPDGNQVLGPPQVADMMIQLQQGFFYREVWPEAVPQEYVQKYKQAKSEWSSRVRVYIQAGGRYDSPGLVRRAVRDGRSVPDDLAQAAETWEEFARGPQPRTETVWVDESRLEALATSLETEPPTLVWFHHTAPLHWAKARGLNVCFAGETPEPGKTIWLGLNAHGTGKNLQPWARNVVFSYQATAHLHEQVLGRTHRPGQTEPVFTVYNTAGRLQAVFDKLLRDTHVMKQNAGRMPKLLQGYRI